VKDDIRSAIFDWLEADDRVTEIESFEADTVWKFQWCEATFELTIKKEASA